eukprot:CAMPEP_0175141596 /NCGR_PEP_ID=MMETSP0087-20121206/12233_1 /TAXON_ID=136419 /ORGANISM="Unknown Unknown, Strain D1" /LENGTH=707 /DNA_ID=CAMNT_0016425109 /DNA_START=142 /DNA_END=2265 /DNA_ORIENTATION=-
MTVQRTNSFQPLHGRWMSTQKGEDIPEAEVFPADKATTESPEVEVVDNKHPDELTEEEVEKMKQELNDDDQPLPDDSYVDQGMEAKEGEEERLGFKAETRKILDIVANSLYTDKEVFVRELISNASDALEKAAYYQRSGEGVLAESEKPFEIRVSCNEQDNILIIQDSGVGMTKEELVENLGTIARSGSKAFVEELGKSGTAGEDIIGQFGVGFYSVFMVATKVEVFSRTCKGDVETAHYWSSDGSGDYSIAQATGVSRGTKIKIHLKESEKKFAIKHIIEGIVKKYSNFVGFPIYLNDDKVNTVAAIWTQTDSTEEQHLDFYRYIANAYDTPFFRLHFRTDAPISINALFYFPERHMEKYGMGRSEPGVSLYCKKVLIQPKCSTILPEWLRFVKGVVDSEDLPLNISRENMQDSALISRMNNVLTKKILKFLEDKAKKDSEAYMKFYDEFGNFLKEGACGDFTHKDQIAKLLRFDSSLGATSPGDTVSLDDYIGRMRPEQNDIFFLCAPNRQFALSSPYYEQFDKEGIEVLFCYSHMDDFVMKNLQRYSKRALTSIESGNAKASEKKAEDKTEEEKKEDQSTKAQEEQLVAYFEMALKDRVSQVKTTDRLVSSPAIVVDHESAAVRKVMKYVDTMGSNELPKQKLEINPKHPMLVKLLTVKDSNPDLAQIVAEQIFDNALIAADILDSPRGMLNRLNKIMDYAVDK